MATPEPYPYRKLNYPINNLEQSFTQEQKLQTRSNIGIPSSVDNEDKVLMVDNAAGELVWAEAPNGLPDIASGDEGKFLSVENGEPAWTDVDIPEQVNADWDATSGVQEILNKPNLATVATTGQYADLSGKPDIPASTSELVNDSGFITLADVPTPPAQLNADWDATSGVQEILNKPTSKRVYAGNNITITEDSDGFTISSQAGQQVNADWDATSGVAEILHKPTIPTATSDLTNDSGFITLSDVPAQVNADWDSNSGASEILNKPDLSIYAETANLATVATTGSYDDLSDKPTIPQAQVNSDWNASSGVAEILNKPNLSTVATTGDYNDLSNKPSIPAAQVNADWTASSGVAEILNKPTLAAVATSGDYSDLSNTPSIPTATSDLTNDSGFITLSDLPPEEVAVMTYGTSTIEEYRAAVQSGKKLIVCRVSDPDDGWCYVMQSQSSPFPEWSYDIGVVHCQLRLDHNGVTGWTTLTTNATTSADAGKVFTVDQYGRQVWATAQGTTYSAGTGIDITNNEISVDYDTNTLDTVYPTLTVNMATAGRYGTLILPTEIQTMAAGSSPSTVTIHIPANTLYLMGDYTANPLRITMGDSEFWPTDYEGDYAQITSVAVSCTFDGDSYTWIDEQDITITLPCNSTNGWSNDITAVYFTISVDANYGNPYNVYPAIASHSTLANPVVFSYPNTSAAQKLAVKNPLPESTSAEAGKYLKVDSNGDPTWATGGGGGGGVNADWDETDPLEPSYIENKPAPKTLTAGRGISIADGVSTVTISSNVTVPVQDVTVDGTSVVSNGVAAITSPTVDQTYDASSVNAQSGVAVASGISAAISAAVIPISIVSTLPANPDPNTLYVVTGA